MIMKPKYLILALLIPGPSSPGNDIDIYLQPLIKDLKDLWEFGLETYDASTNKRFDMHVALMTIVSDFPGYAMLSGWCTKGYLACPECHYKTYSEWFPCSGKNVYRSNRKFLDPSHPWRRDKRNFDGKLEERCQPIPLNGIDIENMLRDFPNAFGKKQNKPRRDVDDPTPWRKKPIKTKDNVSARRDLVELNLMPELQPVELEAGSEEFPRSRFWMSLEQKRKFCQMKRSRPKVTASKNHLMEYELQRLQKLKDNAERMEALGTTSLANKILEDKTKALFCPSATLNSTPENDDDASTSEYDGENEFETDNLTSRIRKASKQVSKQVNKSSLCPKTMADVVEVNSCKKHAVDEVQNIHSLKVARVQDQCIQKKEQVISEKKGSKQAFCSPGSMSAYLEFRKKQKENNEAFVASNQPLNDSLKRNTRICCAAFNENDNDDADAISSWLDEADALNENDDDVGNEHEGVQELEDELLSNYGREGIQEKYMVHEAGREWVMQAINRSWKAHKCFTKRNYFSAYPNDALLWFHKPDTISEPQFREILQYWHSNEAEDPDKQEPSEARVYKQ
uniref:Transposase n=1 Tax=Chenopodium quinoa TaxID=63459 RepID=A0A803ND12_CHEQI